MRTTRSLMMAAVLASSCAAPGRAGSWDGDLLRSPSPGQPHLTEIADRPAIYSFPVNTSPDGWAALKAEPWGNSARLTKVYDGTLFLVVGGVPGWKLVQFKSGERGWIAERLVGCCRPASH